GGPGLGMPEYELLHMPASLRLTDTPVRYAQAVGPAVNFTLTYSQREIASGQSYSSGNIGPKWTIEWLSWVEDNPNSSDVQADVYLRGGGYEHYSDSAADGVYPAHYRTRAVLAKVSTDPVRYERRLADGGVEVFARSDGVITSGRRVFLTDIID